MTINSLRRARAAGIFALAGLLLFVGQSYGQQNSLVFPWQAQGNSPGAYNVPGPEFSPPANVESSRAFYPDASMSDKVLIDVNVPPDAKILFQGANTAQTGTRRTFVSPSIAPGYRYTYNVQATWTENGRQMQQNRNFMVQPGDVVHLTFTRDGVVVRPED